MKTNNTLLIILSILLSIITTSCSSDDNNNDRDPNKALNPPSWTHGTWKDKEGLYVAKFTSDNLIISTGGAILNFSEVARSTDGISISETEKTDTTYKVVFSGTTFHFTKESDNTIALVLASDPKYPAKWLLHKID